MPTTYAIPDGRTVMAATTYTGTGATQTISNAVNGVSFQPDWVWTKARNAAIAGLVYDSVRGATKYLQVNSSNFEGTGADSLTAFASNGFTAGADTSTTGVNQNTTTYVGWQWKAGTSSSITVGQYSSGVPSIASTVSANTTAGFSIVQFTATGATATIGHGLGVTPSMIIVKDAASAGNWAVWHTSLTSTAYYLFMNTVAKEANTSAIWTGSPNSNTFGIGSWHTTDRQIAYCFAAISGYSAFGKYTGNGDPNGPFVYLGFRPRFVMVKRTDVADDWVIVNSNMAGYNGNTGELYPDLPNSEGIAPGTRCDLLSNGFKVLASNAYWNASTGTYIYAAFAENPFKYANAR